jgi:hypothetical protein
MLLYVKEPKDSTRRLLNTIFTFSMIQDEKSTYENG